MLINLLCQLEVIIFYRRVVIWVEWIKQNWKKKNKCILINRGWYAKNPICNSIYFLSPLTLWNQYYCFLLDLPFGLERFYLIFFFFSKAIFVLKYWKLLSSLQLFVSRCGLHNLLFFYFFFILILEVVAPHQEARMTPASWSEEVEEKSSGLLKR